MSLEYDDLSKSQKKRDAQALKDLGVELINMDLKRLAALPLTDALRQAILDARKINSHGAQRRQAQLIGKLMRQANHEEIKEALSLMHEADEAKTAEFHEAERWRERLIKDDNALTAFVDAHIGINVQQLRQFIRKAREDVAKNRNTGAGKALFRFIRSHEPQ